MKPDQAFSDLIGRIYDCALDNKRVELGIVCRGRASSDTAARHDPEQDVWPCLGCPKQVQGRRPRRSCHGQRRFPGLRRPPGRGAPTRHALMFDLHHPIVAGQSDLNTDKRSAMQNMLSIGSLHTGDVAGNLLSHSSGERNTHESRIKRFLNGIEADVPGGGWRWLTIANLLIVCG